MKTASSLDRLLMRARPDGRPVMYQDWDNLLFLHYPIEADVVRPLIPPALVIDTFDGWAWIGITPFAVTNLRLATLPQVPGLNAFFELNVRTYVVYKNTPGVWFFSLDASKLIPTLAARLTYSLPYVHARIDFQQNEDSFRFESKRCSNSAAQFRATWRAGMRLPDAEAESLAFFLVERYCFLVWRGGKVSITRIHHRPWILHEAFVESYGSTMLQPLDLGEPDSEPLVHFSKTLSVEIWPPQFV